MPRINNILYSSRPSGPEYGAKCQSGEYRQKEEEFSEKARLRGVSGMDSPFLEKVPAPFLFGIHWPSDGLVWGGANLGLYTY